jgi:hypothetical protein
MGFSIRAISLSNALGADDRIAIGDVLGARIEFRAGVSTSIRLPSEPEGFEAVPNPERLLTALQGWSRVYRYSGGESESVHVLAIAEELPGDILFYRVDLRQPRGTRRGPRPAVEVVGGAIMTYDECAAWLIDLSFRLAAIRNRGQIPFILARAWPPKSRLIKVAWIGPETLETVAMPRRIAAVGQVYDADIIHIAPRGYRDVAARLAGASPVDTVVVCSEFAPYITADAVQRYVRRELVHVCGGRGRAELELELRRWIGLAAAGIETEERRHATSENVVLLAIMLRGMLSHSKIGQFNHCPKDTVLSGVRARHLDVPAAEAVLDENSEQFQDTKSSQALFLWKDHYDGRQYFLNPREVGRAKAVAAGT